MNIRPATESDIPSIIDGIEQFVRASSYGEFDAVDRDHVTATLNFLIPSPDALVCVMEDGAEFVGCFIGAASPHLFSGQKLLGELFIYVKPDRRGVGGKLRKHAEEWARANGCKTFTIAHPDSEAHLEQVYRHWGFTPCERHYRKELS